MILRVTLQLTEGAMGKLEGVNGFSSDYTGNHIAVFECKLKVPPQLTLIDHTEREYILAHRLNFANWKIVDLDNFMKGNPYFQNFITENDWNKESERLIGPTDRLMVPIDTVQQLEKEREQMQKWEEFMEAKEPRSNVNMTLIYHKRHQEEEAKAALAQAAALAAKKTKPESKKA